MKIHADQHNMVTTDEEEYDDEESMDVDDTQECDEVEQTTDVDHEESYSKTESRIEITNDDFNEVDDINKITIGEEVADEIECYLTELVKFQHAENADNKGSVVSEGQRTLTRVRDGVNVPNRLQFLMKKNRLENKQQWMQCSLR